MEVQENLHQRSMPYVWKRKRTYSLLALNGVDACAALAILQDDDDPVEERAIHFVFDHEKWL